MTVQQPGDIQGVKMMMEKNFGYMKLFRPWMKFNAVKALRDFLVRKIIQNSANVGM